MGSINQKRFNGNREILIFISGQDHYSGYMVIQGKAAELVDIAETALDVNGSEFIALNKALMNIQKSGYYSDQRVKVYCSCENIACVVNGERNPELLSAQFETFKKLTKKLPIQIHWVPNTNETGRMSELSDLEKYYAQDRLRNLSAQMAEYKESHKH